jgi:multidrug efflux pump subunit AcrA (membrane-fusion protein)
MATDYDSTEFVDGDFQRQGGLHGQTSAASLPTGRAPTREEVDLRVAEAQARLSELKRAQEELERERAALEETRRRQAEFQTGRNEMTQHLTRGLGLLEEAEFASRRDAEQMAKAISDMRVALDKVQAIHEETWTKENFSVQLTQALTILENARMEWNSARLKFPVLSGAPTAVAQPQSSQEKAPGGLLDGMGFISLCRCGLALTWPVAAAVLAAGGIIAALLLSR